MKICSENKNIYQNEIMLGDDLKKRLVDNFISLVKIESESRNEVEVAKVLKNNLDKLGAEVFFDIAHKKQMGMWEI